jgi:hypothetical protein
VSVFNPSRWDSRATIRCAASAEVSSDQLYSHKESCSLSPKACQSAMMVLHPAHWHLLEGSGAPEDQRALAAAVVPDLPWYVTQQGLVLVAIYLPEGQRPPLAMPLPPPPTNWQVVRAAEVQVFHVLAVGPLFHESPEELCRRLGAAVPSTVVGPNYCGSWLVAFESEESALSAAKRITESSTAMCQYVAPVSNTLPEIEGI